jgi:hypothetical protein
MVKKNFIRAILVIMLVFTMGFIGCGDKPGETPELPDLTGAVTIDNTSPKVGDKLSASYEGNGTGYVTWQWIQGEDIIDGANSKTYTVTDEDAGFSIKVQVSFVDQKGSKTSDPTDAVVEDDRSDLTGAVGINNTEPKVGDELTATYSGGNGSGDPTWQWIRGNSIKIGANSDTYKVVADDIGETIKVRVSYAEQRGSKISAPTDEVTAADLPELDGTVEIDITSPKVGDTLTATYEGNGSGTPTWQWLRVDVGNEIKIGANSDTYKVVEADKGKKIKVKVSYAEQSGSVESEATAEVTEADLPELTGTVSISGFTPPLKVGDTLTATYSGSDGTGTATWQWIRGSTNITGATTNTYTAVEADKSATLKVKVTYENGSKESAPTAAVAPADLTGTVTITGFTTAPKVGDELKATYEGNGSGTATWQWIADSTNVGTNSVTYVVAAADVGKTIKVRVSYSDQNGFIESSPTDAVAPATP